MVVAERHADENIIVGKINGVYGIKGWVKVYSHTEPKEGIAQYNPWYLKQGGTWKPLKIEACRLQAKTVIAKLEGVDDRNTAMTFTGMEIAIKRDQLRSLDEDQYYWRDLIGLRVVDTEGFEFGIVKQLMETGSNDVLVVRSDAGKETLIPWTMGMAILKVDLDSDEIQVDWDRDF